MIGSATIDLLSAVLVGLWVGRLVGWLDGAGCQSASVWAHRDLWVGQARAGIWPGVCQPVQFGDFVWVVVGVGDFHRELT